MQSTTMTIRTLVILTIFAIATPNAGVAQSTPLEGAWVVTSWEGGEISAQQGLFVFTKTHYSIMFAIGDGPRTQYEGDDQTDDEVLAAYRSFVANTGRYSVDGDQVTTQAYVAKDPNYMGSFPDNDQTYTYRIEDGMLHLTFGGDGPGTGITAIAHQVDDEAGPGSE